jgi:hypothetical protein
LGVACVPEMAAAAITCFTCRQAVVRLQGQSRLWACAGARRRAGKGTCRTRRAFAPLEGPEFHGAQFGIDRCRRRECEDLGKATAAQCEHQAQGTYGRPGLCRGLHEARPLGGGPVFARAIRGVEGNRVEAARTHGNRALKQKADTVSRQRSARLGSLWCTHESWG